MAIDGEWIMKSARIGALLGGLPGFSMGPTSWRPAMLSPGQMYQTR
jgi:hypothetical protein